ncbi:hypothetical protein NITLEN_30149 [Nitrospira lenta]|uniref:Uncharacterized protein n=1 Tax=Nitrospira lenta TaxID=1436998 RepID=A0A330L5Y1_9BACT|nr:hypothetical protein NITLEN_30149 [Nitrospira lenta]
MSLSSSSSRLPRVMRDPSCAAPSGFFTLVEEILKTGPMPDVLAVIGRRVRPMHFNDHVGIVKIGRFSTKGAGNVGDIVAVLFSDIVEQVVFDGPFHGCFHRRVPSLVRSGFCLIFDR